MEFSAEQQAVIDTLINKRVGEVRTAAEARAAEVVATAEAKFKETSAAKEKEFAALLKAAEEKQTKGGEKDSLNLEMKAALDSLKAEREAEKAERKTEKEMVLRKVKTAEILKALGKHNLTDASAVCTLVENDVLIGADEKVTIKGQTGANARISVATGVDMTLDEYLTEWLSTRQYFVRASGAGAGGHRADGAEGAKTKTIKRSEFVKLSPAEQMKFARTEGNQVTD